MTFNDLLLKIKLFEGFSSKVYIDAGGTPTIGYGRVDIKSMNETTTKEKEDLWLYKKVNNIYEQVKFKMVEKWNYNVNENQLLALTDFTYNLGIGNLNKLTDNGQRDISTIAEKILLYNKCNGKELNGLTKRRQWEHDLFTSGTKHLTKAEKLQILINEKYKQFEVDKQIKVDGIVGNETISACIDIFNLIQYIKLKEYVNMEDIVSIIVNNGAMVGCLVYFMFRDYQFMTTINKSLTSVNDTLATIKELLREKEI